MYPISISKQQNHFMIMTWFRFIMTEKLTNNNSCAFFDSSEEFPKLRYL